MGPSGHLYSYWIILDCLGQVCIWVELPVQRRLCPIFVNSVGYPIFTSIPRVNGLSTDTSGIGHHSFG